MALRTAEDGLRRLQTEQGEARIMGLMNVASFGRSVSFVLQGLTSVNPGFDAWYAPRVEEMRADPLLRYFVDLRNKIEKRGEAEVTNAMFVEHATLGDMLKDFGPPPPGSRGRFVGDQFGGSGWEIALPDGTVEKYYVALPPIPGVRIWLQPSTPPEKHLGKDIQDPSVEHLCRLYLDYLRDLIAAAKKQFMR